MLPQPNRPSAAGMWLLGGAVVVMRLTGGTLAHVAGKCGGQAAAEYAPASKHVQM